MTEHVGQWVTVTDRTTGRQLSSGPLQQMRSGRLWVAGNAVRTPRSAPRIETETVVIDPARHTVEVAE